MRFARFPSVLIALPILLPLTGCHQAHKQSPTTTTGATASPTTPSRPATDPTTAPPPFVPSPLALAANPSATAHLTPDSPPVPWDPRFFELTLNQSRPTSIAAPPPTLTKFPASERSLRQALLRLDRPGDDVVYRWIQQRRGGGLDLIDNQH